MGTVPREPTPPLWRTSQGHPLSEPQNAWSTAREESLPSQDLDILTQPWSPWLFNVPCSRGPRHQGSMIPNSMFFLWQPFSSILGYIFPPFAVVVTSGNNVFN